MQPVDFFGSNIVMKRPSDMTEEQCADIPAFKGVDGENFPMVLTAWQPSREDIAAMRLGEPVYLKVIGQTMPPVALYTCNRNFEPNPDSGVPTQKENPNGLHQRYYIQKVVKNPAHEETPSLENEYILAPVDDGSEYFVLRLDDGGGDPNHIAACREAILAYAKAIHPHLPQLAEEISERYQFPLASKKD